MARALAALSSCGRGLSLRADGWSQRSSPGLGSWGETGQKLPGVPDAPQEGSSHRPAACAGSAGASWGLLASHAEERELGTGLGRQRRRDPLLGTTRRAAHASCPMQGPRRV